MSHRCWEFEIYRFEKGRPGHDHLNRNQNQTDQGADQSPDGCFFQILELLKAGEEKDHQEKRIEPDDNKIEELQSN